MLTLVIAIAYFQFLADVARTNASKINVTLPPQRCLIAISKLHSILAVANLLAHDDISQIY